MAGSDWVAFGTSGSGASRFNTPIGIAVASNFQIYVTDFINNRIERIDDMTGTSWTTFGSTGSGTGQFSAPIESPWTLAAATCWSPIEAGGSFKPA